MPIRPNSILRMLAACAIVYSANVRAEKPLDTANMGALTLEDLLNIQVVTASGVSESEQSSPASLFIYTAVDIATHGWKSLADILSYVPGLYVINDGVQPAISARGVNGGLGAGTRIVKIMINGVAVAFRPTLTAFIGPEFIPIATIERVEIAKGPLSVLYGANAFLATVNVITRSPEKDAHVTLNAEANWHQSATDPGYNGSIMATYGSEHLDLIVASTIRREDRSGVSLQNTYPYQDMTQSIYSEKSKDDISLPISRWLKVDLKYPSLGKLSFQAGQQILDSKAEFILGSAMTHRSRMVLQNIWTDLNHTKQWSSTISSEASVGYSFGSPSQGTRLYLSAGDSTYYMPRYDYKAFDASAKINITLPRILVRLGGDVDFDSEHVLWYEPISASSETSTTDTSGIVTKRNLSAYGFFLGTQVTPLEAIEGLKIFGNIRLDRLTYGPLTEPWLFSWRAAATYSKGTDFAAKIFAGRAFQGPSAVLMFAAAPPLAFGTNDNVIGQYNLYERGLVDAPLKPQVVNSVEGVVSVSAKELIWLEGGAFYQVVSDRIQFARSTSSFVASNDPTQARYIGLEASTRLVIDRFSLRVSGTYQHELEQELRIGSLVDLPNAIPLFPNYQLIGEAKVSVPEAFLRFAILARVIGVRSSSDPNALANNLKHYDLEAWKSLDACLSTNGWRPLGLPQTTVKISVQNIFNEHHSEPGFGRFDLPGQGRTYFAAIDQAL